MLSDLAATTARWLPLIAVISLPFLLSLVAVLWQRYQLNRLEKEYAPLPVGTGRFVEDVIARKLLPVDVGVHPDPHGGADGYWPGVGFIALTEGTWKKRYPSSWAVGAHELGHSINIGGSAMLETMLPMARLTYTWSGQAFAAMLMVSALYASPTALWAAFVMALVALVGSAVILADEGMASVHGYRLLQEDGRLDDSQLEAARESLVGSFSVYLSQFLGRLGIVLCWFGVSGVVSGAHQFQVTAASTGAMWMTVVLFPIFVLRIAHVLSQVLAPMPVKSEFRLASVVNEEGRWEFLTGIAVALLVWNMHAVSDHPAFIGAVMLAAVPAVGPVAALGRIPVLLPVLLAVRSLLDEGPDNEIVGQWMREEQVPGGSAIPAPVLAFYNRPPLYLRYSWLLKISFLPLLVGLVASLLAG